MSKNLYKVTWADQSTGDERESFVMADTMLEIEDHYADIIKVEPLGDVEEL